MGEEVAVVNRELSELLNSENGCQYIDLQDGSFADVNLCKKLSLNILHVNIRSLHKNIDSLTLLLNDLENQGIIVHVIGICETFLTDVTTNLVNIENYSAIHCVRSDRSGGGVSLYLHDRVKLTRKVATPFNECFESCAAEIKHNGTDIFVAEFYRIPNTNDKLFVQSFSDLVKKGDKFKTCFLCSDQNYYLLKSHLHRPTQEFLAGLHDKNFFATILKPTCVTHCSGTLRDNIYVRNVSLNKHHSFIVMDGMSDHFPCLLLYDMNNGNKDRSEIVIEKRRITDNAIDKI